jgi:NAD(P)-dependent dehydrogenase (short-subunit alcohol dehydrogenase family)
MKKNPAVRWTRPSPESLTLEGKRVAVVGGTGGIGRAFARFMASRGARVLVVGQTFRDAGIPGIEFVQADLSLMREARRVGASLPAEDLDLVVMTTGIFAAPKRQETAEGIERDMAVSYLSRLVIVREIAERLGKNRLTGGPKGGPKPRIFVMGYPGTGQIGTVDDLNAERSYGTMAAHMNTVAGNEALVLDAARRYPGVGVFGLNPGFIKSDIRANLLGAGSLRHRFTEWLVGLFTPSADDYAERITPLLVALDLDAHSGAMFDRMGEAIQPSAGLKDRAYVDAFLAASEALIAGASSGERVPA